MQLRQWDKAHYQPLGDADTTCTACPCHKAAPRTVGIPSVFCNDSQPPALTRDVLVCIGQNPGNQEDREGLPFVGPTGYDLHTTYLRYLGLKSSTSIYLCNAYRCYHGNGPPIPQAVVACGDHLTADLLFISKMHANAKHKAILCLGQPGWASIARRAHITTSLEQGIFHGQGMLLPIPIGGNANVMWRVFGTYHPAYIMRQRSALKVVQDHLRLVLDFFEDVYPEPSKPNTVPPRFPRRSL